MLEKVIELHKDVYNKSVDISLQEKVSMPTVKFIGNSSQFMISETFPTINNWSEFKRRKMTLIVSLSETQRRNSSLGLISEMVVGKRRGVPDYVIIDKQGCQNVDGDLRELADKSKNIKNIYILEPSRSLAQLNHTKVSVQFPNHDCGSIYMCI